jgi:hypothetical protein
MNKPSVPQTRLDALEWEKRKRDNKRLGLVFAGIVLLIFLASIWKYRPL